MGVPGTAQSLWSRRKELAGMRMRIENLHETVGFSNDFSLFQWAQLTAVVLEWQPDLIIELGRKWGNSTCAFTEAARMLNDGCEPFRDAAERAPRRTACRVESICRDPEFEDFTLPRLRDAGLINDEWLAPLTVHRADIATFDFRPVVYDAQKVLVFWDAHGFEVAATVLGRLLPLLEDCEHRIALHDLSDQRYGPTANMDYAGRPLWAGRDMDGARLMLGHIDTAVPQAVCALDFCTRNGVELVSAEHELRAGLDSGQTRELEASLGPLFSLQAHWFHFSLNSCAGRPTYPRDPASQPEETP